MTVRATKRGDDRTPLSGDWDVIICGASFAGLSVARELHGSGARVLLIDRYEIGERQTSACAIPTTWLENLGLTGPILQTFPDLVIHTAERDFRWTLPWTFSTFDYRALCAALFAQTDATFETAKVEGHTVDERGDITVHTDRGDLTSHLVVDALGWRRLLGSKAIKPPNARMSRGLEIHPPGSDTDLELWLDKRYLTDGYGWSFPARDEVRVGMGSFNPRHHVKRPTKALAADVGRPVDDESAGAYQGNWIPHQMRDAVDGEIFMVGDSAGHCYPTTAEGIRPAIYYGLALGRELRRVYEGDEVRAQALERYAAFCEQDRWAFRALLRVQWLAGRMIPYPAITTAFEVLGHPRMIRYMFNKYLSLAPPSFALDSPAYPGGLAGREADAAAAPAAPAREPELAATV